MSQLPAATMAFAASVPRRYPPNSVISSMGSGTDSARLALHRPRYAHFSMLDSSCLAGVALRRSLGTSNFDRAPCLHP